MKLGETTLRITAALSLLLLCALPVAAFTESYSIAAPSQVALFKCGYGDFSFTITNTGDIPSGYHVSFADAGAAYIRSVVGAKSPFILNAGTSRTVRAYLAMPCDAESSDVQVVVDTVSGKRQTLSVPLVASSAQNTLLTLTSSQGNIARCGIASYTASLTNTHNFTESYSLDVQGAINRTTLSFAQATLAPGASKEIAVSIAPQDCVLSGSISVALAAQAIHSGHTTSVQLPLTIITEGTPQIIAPDTALSRGFPASFTFTIHNGGSTSAVFSVEADGLDGLSVEPSSVLLEGGASSLITVNAANTETSSTGVFPIALHVRSDAASGEVSHTVSLTVKRQLPIRALSIIIGCLVGLMLALVIILAVAEKVDKAGFKRKLASSLALITFKDARSRRKRQIALRKIKEERERQRKLKQIAILRREVARDIRREFRLVSKRAPRKSAIAWRRWLRPALWIIAALAALGGIGYGGYVWYQNRVAVGGWFIDTWNSLMNRWADFIISTRESYTAGAFDAYIPWLQYAGYALGGLIALFILAYIIGRIRRRYSQHDEDGEQAPVPAQETVRSRRSWRGVLVVLGLFAAVALATAAYHFRDILPMHTTQIEIGVGILLAFALIGFISGYRSKHIRVNAPSTTEPHSVRLGWNSGIGEIAFALNEQAEHLSFKVRRRLHEKIYAEPGERLFQYFHVDHTSGTANFGKSCFRFSVPYSWMARMGVAPSDIRLVRFENGAWVRLQTSIVEKNGKRIYFQTDAESLPGQYAIIGKSSKPMRKSALPKMFLVLLALFLAGSLAYVSYPADNGPAVPGIPAQLWDAGTTHKLDLNPFFSDPDGDGLTFSVEGNSHVAIDFQDGVAIMMPPDGWSGSDLVTFIADDLKGGSVRSNMVQLHVRDALIPLEWMPVAQQAIGAALLLVLVATLYAFRKPLMRAFSRK